MTNLESHYFFKKEDYSFDKEGHFQFTQVGKIKYLPYFQCIGVDIDTITTIKRFRTAHRIIRTIMITELERTLVELPPSIDKKWLLAYINGDEVESERMANLLFRREQTGLKIIK